MRSADRQVMLRLGIHLAYDRGSGEDSLRRPAAASRGIGLSVGPQVRRYLATRGRVLPFVLSGFALGASFDRATGDLRGRTTFLTADLEAGAGVEWFPFPRASLRGHTGLAAGVHRAHGGERPASYTAWHFGLDTFTSVLSLQLYAPPRAPRRGGLTAN